jgi:hypothetical protein
MQKYSMPGKGFQTKRLEKNLETKIDEDIYLKLKEEVEKGE